MTHITQQRLVSQIKKKAGILYLFFIAGVCITFCFMMFCTPYYSDDFHYNLITGTSEKVRSLGDILTSQYYHYLLVNGRFVPHFFIQLFDGLWGKPLFNIVNTLFFGAFGLLLSDVTGRHRIVLYLLSLALVVLFMPGFCRVFLWMSGACNYLWVAVLLLSFHKLMGQDHFNPYSYPFLFLYGIICGWTNEALIVGFLAGYLFQFVLYRENWTLHRIILLVGMIIGSLFLVLSPGSIHRFFDGNGGGFSLGGFFHQLFSSLLAMRNLRFFPAIIIILTIAAFLKKTPPLFYKDNLIWVVAACISFIFVLLTRHQTAHSRFGIELFSLVLILRFWDCFHIPRILPVITGTAACFVLSQTLYYSYLNYQEFKCCVFQIKNNTTNIIETNEVQHPPYFDRLVLKFIPSEHDDYYSLQNFEIETFFGKDHLIFLPHRFMERLRSNVDSFHDFEVTNDLPFYAKQTDSCTFSRAVFHLAPPNKASIPLVFRPFADKMERYSAKQIETDKISVIALPQGHYVFVMKNRMIESRVERISLQ